MAAKIIPFPKKVAPLKSARSIDLYYCWDNRLNNPLLNTLFKPEISYVERWFLQTQHLLNIEDLEHPIIKILFSPNDNTLNLLLDVTEKDLAVQRYFSDQLHKDAASVNISKLTRWQGKWQGLLQYRQRSGTL
jgi:hypothetical protein